MLDQNLVRMIMRQAANESMHNSHGSMRWATNEAVKTLREVGRLPKGFSKLEKEYKDAAIDLALDETLPAKLNTPEMRQTLKSQRTSNRY